MMNQKDKKIYFIERNAIKYWLYIAELELERNISLKNKPIYNFLNYTKDRLGEEILL